MPEILLIAINKLGVNLIDTRTKVRIYKMDSVVKKNYFVPELMRKRCLQRCPKLPCVFITCWGFCFLGFKLLLRFPIMTIFIPFKPCQICEIYIFNVGTGLYASFLKGQGHLGIFSL